MELFILDLIRAMLELFSSEVTMIYCVFAETIESITKKIDSINNV